ncbi:MAG: hypothetical protein ACM3UU_02435 [Ignavibacteriales bacterium]
MAKINKKKNYQICDSSQIIISNRFETFSKTLHCTNLHDLLINHLYCSVIVYVASKSCAQKFSGILLKVNPDFVVLLSTRFLKQNSRIIYYSKFITIPIDKIDAVSYPTNIRC